MATRERTVVEGVATSSTTSSSGLFQIIILNDYKYEMRKLKKIEIFKFYFKVWLLPGRLRCRVEYCGELGLLALRVEVSCSVWLCSL